MSAGSVCKINKTKIIMQLDKPMKLVFDMCMDISIIISN